MYSTEKRKHVTFHDDLEIPPPRDLKRHCTESATQASSVVTVPSESESFSPLLFAQPSPNDLLAGASVCPGAAHTLAPLHSVSQSFSPFGQSEGHLTEEGQSTIAFTHLLGASVDDDDDNDELAEENSVTLVPLAAMQATQILASKDSLASCSAPANNALHTSPIYVNSFTPPSGASSSEELTVVSAARCAQPSDTLKAYQHDEGPSASVARRLEMESVASTATVGPITCLLCGKHYIQTRSIEFPLVREADVHVICALWSPEVFFDVTSGSLRNLEECIRRSQHTHCAHCGQLGASVGCVNPQCKDSYHFPCTIEAGGDLCERDFTFTCAKHKLSCP